MRRKAMPDLRIACLGRASVRRVPVDKIIWMIGEYRTRHMGWNVKHFHEYLRRQYGFEWGYSWTKRQLQAAGLVDRARTRGVHRRKRPRKPCVGMMLHQDGSRFEWLEGAPALARGRRHSFDVSGTARGVHGTRIAFKPLYRPRQPLLPHPEGGRGGRQGAAHPGRPRAGPSRDRAHPGVLSGGPREKRAHVRHLARPIAAGT